MATHLGGYEILGLLASGGMAEILLARDIGPSGFERLVVIKRVLPHLTERADHLAMLKDEARLVARLRHPNIVRVEKLCEEGAELFVVMEYLEGESAAGLLRRLCAKGALLELELSAYIAHECAAGLHAAHELVDASGVRAEVVHRDVSPQNIFVTYDGEVKVIDFGVALARDRLQKTETGKVKGKFLYMSPEQCANRRVGAASDVFSLGAVLYELLTGRQLFARHSMAATVRAITSEPIVPPCRLRRDLPRALETICLRALAREPSERYASAADFRKALGAFLHEAGHLAVADALSHRMLDLFRERREEKKELLLRAARNEPVVVQRAEVDLEVELPTVADLVLEEGSTRGGASKRRPVLVLVALVLVSALLFGAVASRRVPDASEIRAAPFVAVIPMPNDAASSASPSFSPRPSLDKPSIATPGPKVPVGSRTGKPAPPERAPSPSGAVAPEPPSSPAPPPKASPVFERF